MDLPATQAIDDDEFAPTQKFDIDENNGNSLVGTLQIDNKTYSIFPGVTSIGRHPACKIHIDHETVSKVHAEIEAESVEHTIFIRDLKSSNKTRINNVKLKPNSSYQFKDGDTLIFGQVRATFKLYQPVEDSFISCTPQVNNKIRSIIPSTPDSSMNASSASENDVSSIPGTQTDETDMFFRRPKIPVTSSTNTEQMSPRIPAFTLDDLPSPLSKDKTKPNDISEAETQKYSTSSVKENLDSSIHSAETQKSVDVNKSNDSNENIYDLETQRPFNSDEDKDNIQNQATQRCDYTESTTRKSTSDVSIYSAETQKSVPVDEYIRDFEIQQTECNKLNSDKRESIDVSIYSAETQKALPEVQTDEQIDNLETQRFNVKNSDKFKIPDSSKIHYVETQKCVQDTITDGSLEDIETQAFDCVETDVNKRKSISESLNDLETQRFEYKTTNLKIPIFVKEHAANKSLSETKTQKRLSEALNNESLDELETQRFEYKTTNLKTPISVKEHAANKSLSEAKIQKRLSEALNNESLDELETQRFEYKTTNLKTPISVKEHAANESLSEAKIQKRLSEALSHQSLNDLETQEFVKEHSNIIIDESTETIESHKLNNQNSKISIDDMETMPFVEDKLLLNTNDKYLDTQRPEEHSFDSGFRSSEQENDHEKMSSLLSKDYNNSDSQISKSLQSSPIQEINKSMIISDGNKKSNFENENHKSTHPIHDNKCTKQVNSTIEDEEDDMFCSQNLIQDCPFAFLPDESQNNDQSVITTETNKIKEPKNENNISDDVLNSSIRIDNKTANNDKEILPKMKHSTTLADDSETDEEGIFSSNTCQVGENEKSIKMSNEHDSETDEEGVFSNHASMEHEKENLSKRNTVDDSETDEEGVFSNHASMEDEKKNLSKKSTEDDSETDDEGVFSNHIINSDKSKKVDNKNSGKNEAISDEIIVNHPTNKNNIEALQSQSKQSIVRKSPTPDSDDNIFDDHYEEQRIINKQTDKAKKIPLQNTDINKEIDELTPTQIVQTSTFETENINLAPTQVINKNKLLDTHKNTTNEVDDLAPTQVVQTATFETQNTDLAPTQVVERNKLSGTHKNTMNEVDDLAPTQVVQTATFETENMDLAPTQIINRNELSDTCETTMNEVDDLAPTQVINDHESKTGNNSEDQFLAPTQIISVRKSQEFDDLDLAPTQKMMDTQDNDILLPTQIINKESNKINDSKNIENTEKVTIKGLNYDTAPTQIINGDESRTSLKSKRHLEEIEISCNKKLKKTDQSQIVKIDLNVTIERNLSEMFEGPVEKPIKEDETLLTQQLANILESSQVENNLEIELNTSLPSPTIGTKRRNIKGKNRHRTTAFKKDDSPVHSRKSVVNLNDTIERNMRDIFHDSINPEEYEPEETLMTQQLKNVLESQDDNGLNSKEISMFKKSQHFSPCIARKHNLSLSMNLNQKSKLSNVQSALDKNETTSQESISNRESQDTEEYFANLKSKRKRNVLKDSQSEDDIADRQLSNNSVKEIVFKRGTVGFSKEGESVSTKERLAFLESKGRSFTSDSQSDSEELNSTLSSSSEKKIVYKRGTAGFSVEGEPVSTKERVAFLQLKGRSFTSDSQSDGEELNGALTNFKTTGKKRFSLSLSKNVDLNSSLSSTSDQEMEKKVCKEQKEQPSCKPAHLSITKKGNKSRSGKKFYEDKIKIGDSARPHIKIRAPGTIGFTDSLEPVESEELVSAASTESEDDQRYKKVCKSKDLRVVINRITTPVINCKITSDQEKNNDIIADSDDELLNTLPVIKVAGTADCPATSSQLAAPSDTEDDDDIISIKEFQITDKSSLKYRQRYDMIYKSEESKIKKETENVKNEISPLEEKDDKISKINEVLAKIGVKNKSSSDLDAKDDDKTTPTTTRSMRVKRVRTMRQSHSFIENSPQLDVKIVKNISEKSNSELNAKDDDKMTPTTTRSMRQSRSFIENSPQLDVKTVKSNSEKSFSKVNDNGDSDSDDSMQLFPTYTPPKSLNVRAMLHAQINDGNNSDDEFEELTKKVLNANVKSLYASRTPQIRKQPVTSKAKSSPKNTRGRRKRALNTSNYLNITRSNDSTHEKPSPKVLRTADKDTSVFQVSAGDSSMKETTATSRMSGLTIIRNKRSAAHDADDEKAQPTKRTKTSTSDDRPKLQELSVPISPIKKQYLKYMKKSNRDTDANKTTNSKQVADTISPAANKKKRATKAPRTLDSYIVSHKSKSNRTDSSDVSALETSVVEHKNESNKKSTRLGSRTRGKAAASSKKAKVDSSIASNNLSKENVIVDDSDVERAAPKATTRSGRSAKSRTNTDASVVKDSSKDEASSSNESEGTKRRGRGTRQNQKKNDSTKQADKLKQETIIQDSDPEHGDETEFVSKETKGIRSKIAKISDLGTSGKINTIGRSQRIQGSGLEESENRTKLNEESPNIKESKLKQLEKTQINKGTRSRKGKITTDMNLEKSEIPIDKRNKSRRDKTLEQSLDSVFSESSDNDRQINASIANKSKTSSSTRQTRKRAAATAISAIEVSSSEESQEIAEIFKNYAEKQTESNKLRRGRSTKRNTVSSSEDTQGSEGNKSNVDDIFEKPVSRPKRARLNKSVQSESTPQHNSDDKHDLNVKDSLHISLVSQRKNTPSPTLLSSSCLLTPTRLRRSISTSPMKGSSHAVLFTGEKSDVHRKIVKKLGGYEVEDLEKCSILVTDKARRTFKFLCCLAQGIPIVSVNWLNDSNKACRFLNWEDYILQDPDAEAQYKFNLKESLEKSKKHKLLEGYTVLLTSQIKKPPVSELKEMVTYSGGKPLLRAPAKWPEKTVVVTIEEALQNTKKLIAKAPKSIPVCSTEFILTGLLRQEVNVQEFKL